MESFCGLDDELSMYLPFNFGKFVVTSATAYGIYWSNLIVVLPDVQSEFLGIGMSVVMGKSLMTGLSGALADAYAPAIFRNLPEMSLDYPQVSKSLVAGVSNGLFQNLLPMATQAVGFLPTREQSSFQNDFLIGAVAEWVGNMIIIRMQPVDQ